MVSLESEKYRWEVEEYKRAVWHEVLDNYREIGKFSNNKVFCQVLVFIMLVSMLVSVVNTNADTLDHLFLSSWSWLASEPQSFQSFDGHIIAVGTKNRPEHVHAVDIQKALSEGKEIRLSFVTVIGDLNFHSEVKQATHFAFCTFTGDVIFSGAFFRDSANFSGAIFSKSVSEKSAHG